MLSEVLYLSGIVFVGWFITIGMRALPFLLFGRKNRELPKRLERVCEYISPVIIAFLIVYSYSGLAWREFSPYIAGLVTVGLQLAFRNPLVSIILGTVLYMYLQ